MKNILQFPKGVRRPFCPSQSWTYRSKRTCKSKVLYFDLFFCFFLFSIYLSFRDFLTPTAWFEDRAADFTIISKYQVNIFLKTQRFIFEIVRDNNFKCNSDHIMESPLPYSIFEIVRVTSSKQDKITLRLMLSPGTGTTLPTRLIFSIFFPYHCILHGRPS